MPVLRSTSASPFARQARIAIDLLGLAHDIEVRETDLNDPADSIRGQNPLGKVPALILDDGAVYYDSRVILEYLDWLAGGGRIVPREARARLEMLRLQALCDGVLDAALLIVYEGRYRPAEMRVQSWIDRQADKVARGFAALEAKPPTLDPLPDAGQIALACMLGYHDLRFGSTWRADHPTLVAWLGRFAAQVPAYAATEVES